MFIRIVTAIILIAAVLCWLFWADYPVYAMGALLIYMVSAYELGPLLGFRRRYGFVILAALGAVLLFFLAPPGDYVINGVPRGVKYLIASGLIVWLGSLPLLVKYPELTGWHRFVPLNALLGLLMLLPYLAGLLLMRVQDYASDRGAGAWLVLAVMALVWCADSGAYFSGRFLGKTKMLPRVSPKKTLEGLAGGLLAALVGMIVFSRLGLFGPFGSDLTVLLIAAPLAIVFSVVGDLVESMLKRMAGIKDSGRIFPGHGGMLDRVDSQLAAIPVFLSLSLLLGGELF